MEKSGNKIIYIVVGIILAIIAIPIVLMLIGGIFYYWMGATN